METIRGSPRRACGLSSIPRARCKSSVRRRRLKRLPRSITRGLARFLYETQRLIERTTQLLHPDREQQMVQRRWTLLIPYSEKRHRLPLQGHGAASYASIRSKSLAGDRMFPGYRELVLDPDPAIQAECHRKIKGYLVLLQRGFDVALRIGPAVETLPAPHRLGEVRRIVVASRDYLLEHGEPRVPRPI